MSDNQQNNGQSMQIFLSAEQTQRIRALVDPINAAHARAGEMFCGYEIRILFSGPLGTEAEAHCGDEIVSLGEVEIDPSGGPWGD